jgi:two-component system response regulator
MNSILLVEDSTNDETLVTVALQRQPLPYELVVVRDGREALDYLFGSEPGDGGKFSYAPSFVLLDLKLPKIPGLDVLQKIREHPGMRFMPVVIWSSSCELADLQKAYRLGANSYVQKPAQFEQLSEAIREITSYWLKLNRSPSATV